MPPFEPARLYLNPDMLIVPSLRDSFAFSLHWPTLAVISCEYVFPFILGFIALSVAFAPVLCFTLIFTFNAR